MNHSNPVRMPPVIRTMMMMMCSHAAHMDDPDGGLQQGCNDAMIIPVVAPVIPRK